MKEQGFVCFHRKIHEWEWYTDSFTFHLFFHCISCANFTNKKWRGVEIKRGQFITGRKKLSVETGLSEQQVRTCLKRLKSTNELTIETTTSYSIITVNNYDEYQFLLKNQPTKQQSNNQRLTTTNNDNKDNSNICNINLSSSSLSKEDEEILKNLSKRNKIKYFRPWLRKITANGDYIELLSKEKERLQTIEEKKAKEQEEKAKEDIPPVDAEEEKRIVEACMKRIRAKKK